MKKILVTCALPYANGPLHFGHIAGAYLPADCYARFERLSGSDVLFLCGSDEYGIAITLNAELAGRTPKEHVDIFHHVIKSFFQKLGLSFDHYSRTTWEGHKEPTIQFFKDLMENGYIEPKETEQLYSEADKKFLADRYVVGTCPKCGFESARGDECQKCGSSYEAIDLLKPRSKLTGASLTRRRTTHWFLLLDKLREKVEKWLSEKDWKPNVANFAKNYLSDIRPRAITRDSDWGIPVPASGAEGKVLYVWFDAPIGYISAAKEWALLKGEPQKWEDYWFDPQTKLVQFIGKDNIPFHAVIFPAMIMGQNHPYKLVDELPANEFYNLEGKQFSKSEGWYIDLDEFFKKYTPEQIRYSIAANAPENSDSEFTWKDFQQRCNAELLGKYGNFVNRVLVFVQTHCQGQIPPQSFLSETDKQFLDEIHRIVAEAYDCYSHFRLRRASQCIMELATAGNVYFDANKPWQDLKEVERLQRMQTTISLCLQCLKLLALISSPIIPQTAQTLWGFLGFTTTLSDERWQNVTEMSLQSCQHLPKPHLLFRKVEDSEIEEEIAKLKALSKEQDNKNSTLPPLKKEISFEKFEEIDLRVGQILAVNAVAKSKKLLQLTVDLGLEKRTILSGISQFYQPEQLIGKKVIIVANLKTAVKMGIESQGMILASQLDQMLELPFIQHLPPGSIVS